MKRIIVLTATLLSLSAQAPSVAAIVAKNFTVGYTKANDISQKSFAMKTGEKVHLEVNPTETGAGCMSSIMVPGLWNKPEPLVKGKKIVMEFTPQRAGAYKITCAMGVPRGVINVH
jgi:uncharacterized protein